MCDCVLAKTQQEVSIFDLERAMFMFFPVFPYKIIHTMKNVVMLLNHK